MKLVLQNVRIAFPALFQPQSIEGSPPKYGVKLIIDPARADQVKAIDEAMQAVAKEKWGANAEKVFSNLVKTGKPKNVEVCFVKEPYRNREGDAYDGFEDAFYFSASNAARPYTANAQNEPVGQNDGVLYAGCYAHVSVELWAQDNKWGKGIRATLKGVMFHRDGDAFSGGAPGSPDDFADLAQGADEMALA